jgi:uncharacterized protein (TIGR03437 family)
MNFGLQLCCRRPLFQLFVFGACLAMLVMYGGRRVQGQMGAVTTVSAASYAPGAAVAPDSIVTAFGAKLATGTAVATTLPLPTTLGGTTVRVNGQLAPLFFVSAGQVNFAIPPGIAAGTATVTVNVGDGSVSQGTVQIAATAPGVFTANSNGLGVSSAVIYRVIGGVTQQPEAVAQAGSGGQVPRPIDLGPEGEQVFLALFLTGVRGGADPNGDGNVRENVRVIIGGTEIQPDYAGKQGTLTALDQINVEIPRSLIGRGRVNVAVTATGAPASNLSEIDIAARPGAAPPQINAYNPGNILVRNDLTITGSGFSATAGDNLVRIGGVEATVNSATSNQLSVKAPWGVIGGSVTVRTGQGEGASSSPVAVRTSISGLLEDTDSQPIVGASVKVRNTSIAATSVTDGTFILPDIPFTGLGLVDIDPNTSGGLPYPIVTVRRDVLANRDNEVDRTNPLEAATGPSMSVGTGGSAAAEDDAAQPVDEAEPAAPTAPTATITTDGVTLDVPGSATARFPDGRTQGLITLTSVRNSRTPVNLPPGVFSSTIVQITPFRVRLSPGGTLTFPNRDGLTVGSAARLYKFDQTTNSPTIGTFIDVGPVTVSADGRFVQTNTGVIQETSYYFVAIPRQTTTVIGRIVESDGRTPVRRARANLRGQEAFTDGNGGFVLAQVPATAGESLAVAATVIRSIGRVDRGVSKSTAVVIGGVTNVGDIVLGALPANLPPNFSGIPASLTVTENIESRFEFKVFDPNPNQSLRVTAAGANFISILPGGNNSPFTMVLSPKTGAAGRYTITVTAVDSLGLARSVSFPLRVNRPPIANAQTVEVPNNTPRTITLAGSDPDQDSLNFLLLSSPKNGVLSSAPPAVTYTPNAGFVGQDEFMFKANDGFADSPGARVVIVVAPPTNRPPVLTVPGTQTVSPGKSVNFSVTGTDPDSNQILTITPTRLPTGATFTTTGQNPVVGVFNWLTPAGTVVNVTVTFSVTDNGNPKLSDSKTVNIRSN